jgi:hypothetical protein
VVDYIVKQTLAPLIEGKTPKQIEKIRILDPSCGSGSFLIGAFKYLIDHHVHYLTEHPNEGRFHPLFPDLISDDKGTRLSLPLKAKILRNNLFGVDIDPQAVEITMMSLYLKALEGEKSLLPPKQHLLPELKYNILCGNSLVGTDFPDQGHLYGEEERDRINRFDWQAGFPDITKSGGFDAVIGNPPWVFTREGDFDDLVKKYIDRIYLKGLAGSQTGRAKQSGKINLFAIFILKSLRLLRKRGQFGYIVPNTLLRATVYDVIRKYLLDSVKVRVVADLGAGVFQGVTASTVILIIESAKAGSKHRVRVARGLEAVSSESAEGIPQASFLGNTSFAFNLYADASSGNIIKRMASTSLALREICLIRCGIATGPGKNKYISDHKLSAAYKPLIEGKDVKRYAVCFSNRFILYDRTKLHRPRDESIFLAPEKLVTQRIGGGDRALVVAFDDQQFYTFNSTNALLPRPVSEYSLKYVLGLLNSRLLNWYYIVSFTNRSRLTVNISQTFLERLPIRRIDLSDPADKSRHDNVVTLVNRMLELNKKKYSGNLAPSQLDGAEREIAATDLRLDELVYKLYGITDDERRAIESTNSMEPVVTLALPDAV